MMQIVYIISAIILVCSADSHSEWKWTKIDNCSYEHMDKNNWGRPQCFLQIYNSHYKCTLPEECETKIAPCYITSSFDVCAFSKSIGFTLWGIADEPISFWIIFCEK